MENTTGTGCYITKQIGSTFYRVKVCFKENTEETMQEKILRMIDRELSTNGAKGSIINIPQMSRPI